MLRTSILLLNHNLSFIVNPQDLILMSKLKRKLQCNLKSPIGFQSSPSLKYQKKTSLKMQSLLIAGSYQKSNISYIVFMQWEENQGTVSIKSKQNRISTV